jgi:6-pyruvoyltetrahydropterin/6-carboxytetrahydropterin synthase
MNGERYALTVRSSFSAAHRLLEYEGNCERLHGHNWQVEVTVESEVLDFRGMALDFRVMKASLNEILSRLDHKYLNEVPPFDARNPSSENIARHIFEEMEGTLSPPVRLARVAVWESEDAWAEYSRRRPQKD